MKKSLRYLIMFIIISVFLMAIMPNMIYAPPSILYVDWRNNSGTENGTETYPFNTIGEAVAVVTNGWTISVASGTYNESLSIGLTAESITIEGEDDSNTIIKGSGSSGVLGVFHNGGGPDNDVLVLRNLTITDGVASNGGGINSSIYRLEVYNCNIYGNHATNGGGGISSTKTTIIDGCNISNNWAASGVMGGGIYFSTGTLTITNSIIGNNSAGDFGSGIFAEGGGIWFRTGTLNISNCSIYNNITKSGSLGSSPVGNAIDIGSTLNATMNWWGSSSGPYQDPLNVSGQGNSIIGSGLLLSDFYPWLTSDPFAASGATIEPVWIRTMPMTCSHVWINEDNKFQFVFQYPYRDNNWVKIYDMSGKEVYSVDMPYDNPNLIVDLPNGMYTVKTFTVGSTEPIQTFIIGKP
jgi:hypothetical protein